MTTEYWRPVVGYENKYEVSSCGRIRTTSRKYGKVKTLKISKDSDGYFRTALFLDDKGYYPFVHTVVAQAFLGPRPEGYQVDHINQIKDDNRVENLRYVSRSINQRNTKRKPASKYNGVYWHKINKRWVVQANAQENCHTYLGCYGSEIYAAFVFDRFCIKEGIDCELNFY